LLENRRGTRKTRFVPVPPADLPTSFLSDSEWFRGNSAESSDVESDVDF